MKEMRPRERRYWVDLAKWIIERRELKALAHG